MNSNAAKSDALWHLVSDHTKAVGLGGARIQICLLGSPRFLVDGESVTAQIKYRKGIALLSYLAVECGFMHPRERIAHFFWPHLSRPSALTNLRQVLSNLSRVLCLQDPPGDPVIKSDTSHIGLFPCPALDMDIHTLNARSAETHTGRAPRLQPAYEPPLHGFLEGFELPECIDYTAWLEKQRRQFDSNINSLHEKAIARAVVRDDLERAILHARIIERNDPLLESNQVCLMRLLVESGRAKKALQQFELFCKNLRDELDVEPEPATSALHQHILQRVSAGETRVSRPKWHFDQLTNTTVMYVTCDASSDAAIISEQTKDAPSERIRAILSEYSHKVVDSHGLGQFAYFANVHEGDQRGLVAINAARAVMARLPCADSIRIGIYSGQVPGDDPTAMSAHCAELTELARRLGFVADSGDTILCADTLGKLAIELEYLGEWRFRGINRVVHAYRLEPEGNSLALGGER